MAAGSITGVKAETCDDEESVTVRRIDGHPFPRTAFSVAPEFIGWRRSLETSDCMQNVSDGTGAIIRGIVKGGMTAAVSVRFSDYFISSPNCLTNNSRRFSRSYRQSVF